MVTEVFDLPRVPDELERKGKFKTTQKFFMQGVYPCRLDAKSRYIEVALVRGLCFSGGSLEDSYTVLTSYINEATEQVKFYSRTSTQCYVRSDSV